jgi:hypothetical protein
VSKLNFGNSNEYQVSFFKRLLIQSSELTFELVIQTKFCGSERGQGHKLNQSTFFCYKNNETLFV